MIQQSNAMKQHIKVVEQQQQEHLKQLDE